MRALLAAIAVLVFPAVAMAEPLVICVPRKASTAIKTPNLEQKCPVENERVLIPTPSQSQIWEHLLYTGFGRNAQADITVEAADLIVEHGTSTKATGNLLIGNEATAFANGDNIGRDSLVIGRNNQPRAGEEVFLGEGNLIQGESIVVNGSFGTAFGKAFTMENRNFGFYDKP